MFCFKFLIFTIFLNSNFYTLTFDSISDSFSFEKPVYKNSIQIYSKKTLLTKDQDYSFDGKTIYFKKSFFDVSIFYQISDTTINTKNFKYGFKDRSFEDILPQKENNKENILFTGTQGFTIQSEKNFLQVDQTTEINIKGDIDSFWYIEGELVDNSSSSQKGINMPVYQIENLDFSLNNKSGTRFFLGNSLFSFNWSKFLDIKQNIFGIGLNSKIVSYPLFFVYSAQKGNIKSKSFFCFDGVQGPYSLTEQRNVFDYTITPNSERVYLNGEQLKNGENEDYTMDYYSGTITFTNKRIVDGNSYIYVEFQQFEQFSLNTGYHILLGDESKNFKIYYANEATNVYDKNIIEKISTAGNDSSHVNIPGFEYVGKNEGEYILDDSIFVYRGKNEGDYKVEFYYVGFGNGDYIYIPSTNSFTYAGKNNGNYSPYTRIDLPFFYHLLDISMTNNSVAGKTEVELLTGLYKFNRYSINSNFKNDISYLFSYETKDFYLKTLSSKFSFTFKQNDTILTTKWNYKKNYDIFYPDTIIKIPYREIKFKIDPSVEKFFKSNLSFRLNDSLNIFDLLVNGDTIFNFSSNISYLQIFLKDSVYYARKGLELTRFFKYLNFTLFLEEEKKEFDYFRRGIRCFTPVKTFLFEYKNENGFNDSLLSKSFDSYRLEYNKIENNILSFSLSGEFRILNDMGLQKNIFVVNTYFKKNLKNILEYNFNGSINSLSSYKVVETYIYAGRGNGEYVYDSLTNTYIYDRIYGDYILIEETVQSDEPVSKRDAKFSLNFNPFETFLKVNYQDLSKNFYTTDLKFLKEYSLRMDFNIEKIIPKSLTPFLKSSVERRYLQDISSFFNIFYDVGIKNKSVMDFYLFYRYNIESDRENSGEYRINSTSYNFKLALKGFQQNYDFSLSILNFSGYYEYQDLERTDIAGRKIEFTGQIEKKIIKDFYLKLLPTSSYTIYSKGNDQPLVINYKLPSGIYFENNITLTYSSKIFNSNISYIMDYSFRNSFRQRMVLSLFTFF